MQNQDKNITVRDVIQIDNELLHNISSLIEDEANQAIKTIFANLHPADIAEIINHLPFDDAQYVFGLLDTDTAVEVVTELDEELREKVLNELDKEKITDIVDELDTDDATDIVSDLPEEVAEHVLDNIDPEDSEDVKELMKYPEESAGGLMNSDFVSVDINATVNDAIEAVRIGSVEDKIEDIYTIYVLADDDTLLGFVNLKELIINPPDTPIKNIMEEDLIYVTADMDQEEVANIMDKYDLISIPVVDENKVMLGRITIDDVVDVIQEEAAEDLQKVAGLTEDEEYSYSTIRISRNRLPWLFVSLGGELISAGVLSSFQASIEQIIIASFFIPIVMALGGSAGSQAAIVTVQGMSGANIWWHDVFKRLLKEFRVATLNGFVASIVLLIASKFFFNAELDFGLILSLSLFIIIVNATMIGAIVPVIFKKVGVDPAIATGPIVSAANDIMGLLIYLSLVTIFFTV